MKFSFEITRDDYVEYNKAHFMRNGLKRTVISGVLVILVLQFLLNEDDFNWLTVIISTLMSIVIYYIIIRITIKRTGSLPAEDGSIIGPREMEFNENEIICNSGDSTSNTKWIKARELVVGKKGMYLYIDTQMAFLIPRRAFASLMEENAFIDLVNSKSVKVHRQK